jgi:hypothetical protein
MRFGLFLGLWLGLLTPFALSLYDLLFAWPELKVRAIRVPCESAVEQGRRS